MRKLICALALFAAVGALAASATPVATAQQKKDDKKDPKKDDKDKKDDKKDPKKDDLPGTIEVYQGKDGWRYRVVGPDGKTIAIGVQGFAKKEDCLAVIEVLKTTLAKAKVAEPKDDKK